ncbi:uncharacterized protein LOC130946239 [Arachis stenosperma]|uniref:uncharacterized protein LOC130946239 n=1 Tax=Arachis stenosperma TaxID=217475 RepID=UPI0025ACF221|nr:uncharacterized protein LOC130946239 [Arachis stenosperma]
MNCVTASSLSILWNENRLNGFTPSRGLRQGDLMSPYLFVLCMERLLCFISHQVDLGLWEPVAVSRGGPRISHLMFADDLLLFCKATKRQVQNVMLVLATFCKASGMKINVKKSKALSSKNVSATRKEVFTGISSIRFVQDLGKYLGFTLSHSRVTRSAFNGVLDKIQSRLASWKGSFLNRAGRLCLVNSVAAAISMYQMQLNKLWVQVLDAKYRSSLYNCFSCPKNKGSPIWRSLCKAWEVLKDGFAWCIGDLNQNFWFSSWRREGRLSNEIDYVHISDSNLRIQDIWSVGRWHLDTLYSPLSQNLKVYDSRNGYLWLCKKLFGWEERENWLWLWRQLVPKKHKFSAWLCLKEALPTTSFRFRRGMSSSDRCPRCLSSQESVLHCIRDCPKAQLVWHRLDISCHPLDLKNWFLYHSREHSFKFFRDFGGYGEQGIMTSLILMKLGLRKK